ncbi:hypothetical protein NP233_g5544 [Leucocoprinus birnbaumii]|uniref:Aspartate aminotransferase n=1 Tax=Leucocoprinus birnbaumii TaxID=56174 RepID=A0AAD5VSM0_9AGAR|nr:hypothetical protein NP233_g5544 [Leucocoprinus birnbaumii]
MLDMIYVHQRPWHDVPLAPPDRQRQATQILLNSDTVNHEYLPILGHPEFNAAAARLILGPESSAIREKRVASVQTISGTGANHLGALFLSKFYSFREDKEVYLSRPTWANHPAIFRDAGIKPAEYPYFDPKTTGLDFNGLLKALNAAPEHSVFLFHACAHNPTGIDPTQEQWKEIARVVLECKHFVFFDCAYRGFGSGNLDQDAFAVRYFANLGIPLLICQSFAKNAGLYGERVGALHFVVEDSETVNRVQSQLSLMQRTEICNPPSYGASLMILIMKNPELFEEWKQDILTMVNRISAMRNELYRLLTEEFKTPGRWDHIVKQVGMFSYTGIGPKESRKLVEIAHVYLTENGHVSMAGLNTHNIRYFAEYLDKVVRGAL